MNRTEATKNPAKQTKHEDILRAFTLLFVCIFRYSTHWWSFIA